ncbi:hypothetical protein ACJJTC_009626 [Scirpophaga incertulas]
MANSTAATTVSLSKYRITRRGKTLFGNDEQKLLAALPKDVQERTWSEVLQKEDNDLFILNIREDILDKTMDIIYERYMETQTVSFTVHCAAQAWLKLIDWEFYRHDPGEDPTAYPPCYIPHREQSWMPDDPPDPSPKDSWCKHDMPVMESFSEEVPQKSGSASSLELPVVEEIPSEYWFPGKVNVPEELRRKKYDVDLLSSIISTSFSTSEEFAAESEVLQKVTDYSNEEATMKMSSSSTAKTTPPVIESKLGAGDSTAVGHIGSRTSGEKIKPRRHSIKSKLLNKSSMLDQSGSSLSPLDEPRSRASVVRDFRLRSLRLDTQYEISSEKTEPPFDPNRRK